MAVSARSDSEAAISAILGPSRVWSRDEVMARPSPVPTTSGIYGWYFRAIPATVPTNKCVRSDAFTLLYVGIAPGFPGSKGNLRRRIRTHFRPRRRSTLRRDLGCLLESSLALQIELQSDGTSFYYGETELVLSEWMAANAFVAWAEHPEPWLVEKEIIQRTDLPLNINHNRRHPFCATLQALRKDARLRAKALAPAIS